MLKMSNYIFVENIRKTIKLVDVPSWTSEFRKRCISFHLQESDRQTKFQLIWINIVIVGYLYFWQFFANLS